MNEIEPVSAPSTFAPGDVVELKSGGPAMTVVAVEAEGVRCLWYAEMADEVKSALVPAICLEPVSFEDDDEEEEDEEEDEEDKGKKRGKKKHRDDD